MIRLANVTRLSNGAISLRKKSDEKLLFFLTIHSDFTLEQGPFIKTRHLSFYKGHLGERGKSEAVVDGWIKTRGNAVYVLHDKKECELLWKGDSSDRFDGI